jgi:hypothetical protein
MDDPEVSLELLQVGELRRRQRRRFVVRVVLVLVLASVAVWGISTWSARSIRRDGELALAQAHRAYVTALRRDLPPSWSIARVVQAHALARLLQPHAPHVVEGLTDACYAIRDASYAAGGDTDEPPCHGLDLAWGDCRLEWLEADREAVQRFAAGLRDCEADLGERLRQSGRELESFGLGGDPLPDELELRALPQPPPELRRDGFPLALPSAVGAVVVDFTYERECDHDNEVLCLRHLVWRLSDEGWAEPQRIDPLAPVRVWWRIQPLDDGAVLLAGEAPEALVVGRVGLDGRLSTTAIPGGGGPRTIVPLRGGRAQLESSEGQWIVDSDLSLEPTDAPPAEPAFAFAGPARLGSEPWAEDAVASVGGDARLHLRREGAFVVAERRSSGATTTALADRVMVLEDNAECEAHADREGRVVLLCEQDDRPGVLVSDDGGRRWHP